MSKTVFCQALVAYACNPSYSRSGDKEDCGSKPAPANSSMRLYLEKPFTKIGLVERLKVKVKPQYHKKRQYF
jgi:hypothetical protein